jgi:thiol-disulfide oxidoreductase resA|uniref:redoxin domain-containing protein n=1 Tax=Butyricimonas faecalis TaxID=2093856 RepID=UPI003FF0930B
MMNRGIILLLFVSVLLCIGCSDTQHYKFTLRGNLEGIMDGEVALLKPFKNEVLCSTRIEGGKFELKGCLEAPGQFGLKVGERSFLVFMDGHDMRLDGAYESLSANDLKGSPANDLEREYRDLINKEYYGRQWPLLEEYKQADDAGDVKLADKVMTQVIRLEDTRYELTREFARQHPDNIFSAYASEQIGREVYRYAKGLYEVLGAKVRESQWGIALKKHVDDLVTSIEGTEVPDFTVTDEEGNKVSMSSLRGSVVVLDFWASWCGPCRKEMKSLRELYKELEGQGVRFVSISLDDSEERWKKACEEEQIPWLSALAEGGWEKSTIRKALGIESIPHIIVVDKEGKIAAKNARRNILWERLEEILNKK